MNLSLDSPKKFLKLLLGSLTPLLIVFVVFLVILVSLLINDRVLENKETELANSLSQNLTIDASCGELINPGQNIDFKFSIDNQNDQELVLLNIGIDKSLIGFDGKLFSNFVKANPTAVFSKSENNFYVYRLEPKFVIAPKTKKELVLTLQAEGKDKAKANPNTIVQYKGQVFLQFEHRIISHPTCEMQVRYS